MKIAIAGLGEYTAMAPLSLRATTRNPARQASQHRFGQEYMPNMALAPVQHAQAAT